MAKSQKYSCHLCKQDENYGIKTTYTYIHTHKRPINPSVVYKKKYCAVQDLQGRFSRYSTKSVNSSCGMNLTNDLALFQLAAGSPLDDLIDSIKKGLEGIVDEAQKALESLQENSDSTLNNILEDAKEKLDEILPEIEKELADKFSNVAEAAEKIRECLENQRDNISAIVESASEYANFTQDETTALCRVSGPSLLSSGI
jgi:DNA-binding ferritin-like protein